MSMLSPRHRIAYFPVPKAACTSLKLAIYQLEHGRPFDNSRYQGKSIQLTFPTSDFAPSQMQGLDDHWKFAVVRDPFSRIISAYTNKFNFWSKRIGIRMSKPDLRKTLLAAGIPEKPPTLIEFCLRLDTYRQHFKSIRHHTDPFQTFLGPDLSVFDRVYRMEELGQFTQDISQRIGRDFVLPHSNKSKPVDRTMNDAATEALRVYCAPDYAYLANYYPLATPSQSPSINAPKAVH